MSRVVTTEALTAARAERLRLRETNLAAPSKGYPTSDELGRLDSSIKKTSAFLRKLRQLNADSHDALVRELPALNLARYLSEAVAGLLDARLKVADIATAVEVASMFVQRYPECTSLFQKAFQRTFQADAVPEDERTSVRRRILLRLMVELTLVHVLPDPQQVFQVISSFLKPDLAQAASSKPSGDQPPFPNLVIANSFAKVALYDILGAPLPEDYADAATAQPLLPEAQRQPFIDLMNKYYQACVGRVLADHKNLQRLERQNSSSLMARGSLSGKQKEVYEAARVAFDKFLASTKTLAESMHREMEELPSEEEATRLPIEDQIAIVDTRGRQEVANSLWDDEDTRLFYESLPDLMAQLPPALLPGGSKRGDAASSAATAQTKPAAQPDASASTGEGVGVGDNGDGAARDTKSSEAAEADKPGGDTAGDAPANEPVRIESLDLRDAAHLTGDADGDAGQSTGVTLSPLDELLSRLPSCVNIEMIDALSLEYCYINNKAARRRMASALFRVPRTRLGLVPYYARMTATLSKLWPDISTQLVSGLYGEFKHQLRAKDPNKLETRIRNVRFLGELCKFRVVDSSMIFHVLNDLLHDFTHSNVDVACHLLEVCGRYLYRVPLSQQRMTHMLDTMMRLKSVRNFDNRQDTMVQNAYYQCKPPDRPARAIIKDRPPLHEYIRKLLFTDLTRGTLERVLKQLRKLPWPECEDYLLRCMLNVQAGKFDHIHLVSSLAASLAKYHETLPMRLVDAVLELIQYGMDENDYRMQQQRVTYCKFLGELYNYRLVDSTVIFDTLYTLTTFAAGDPVLDAPEDHFRLRLICTLLETCGMYFDSGASKRKLDRFFIYLQRYIFSKTELGHDARFAVSDLFQLLRPGFQMMEPEQVAAEIARLEAEDEEARIRLEQLQLDAALVNSSPSHTPTSSQRSQDGPQVRFRLPHGGVRGRTSGMLFRHSPSDTDSGPESQSLTGTQDLSLTGTGCTQDEDTDGVAEVYESESEGESWTDDTSGSSSVWDSSDDDEMRQPLYPGDDDEDDIDAAILAGRAPKPTVEDTEFDAELARLVSSSIETRRAEPRPAALDIPIPVLLRRNNSGLRSASTNTTTEPPSAGPSAPGVVGLRLLTKRGNKQAMRSLDVPVASGLAHNVMYGRDEARQEQQEIKRITLEQNAFEEEEDLRNTGLEIHFTAAGSGRNVRPRRTQLHPGRPRPQNMGSRQ